MFTTRLTGTGWADLIAQVDYLFNSVAETARMFGYVVEQHHDEMQLRDVNTEWRKTGSLWKS